MTNESVQAGDRRTARGVLLGFVLLVDMAAIAAVGSLPRFDFSNQAVPLLFMAGFAALTGFRPINIRPLRTTVSASDPFVFATVAAAGGLPAVIVGLASIVSSMIGAGMRFSWTKTPFNLAASALSIASASFVFEIFDTGPRVLQQAVPLALATSVYFLVNTTLISAAIAIDGAASFFATWKRTSGWTAVTIYSATTLAIVLLFVLETAGPAALVLGVPPLWLFFAYYKSHRDRLAEQQARMEEILELNQRLELEVGNRTAQLAAKVEELERARSHLRELANTDELTLLANRRRFRHYLEREFSRSKRFHHGFSILLIDIDHFKRVNDRFGHSMGDLVLQQVATSIDGSVRKSDLAARYGGEEFAVVLAETGASGALVLAEQLRQRIAEQTFGTGDHGPGRITVSAGVASYPQDADGVDELIEKADRRLYEAKQRGRDRVVASDEDAKTFNAQSM